MFGQNLYVAPVPFSKKIAKPRGGLHKTPQEATNCRTNNLLKLQMAIWNLKICIWKLQLAILKFAMRKLKRVILKPKTIMRKLKLAMWKLCLHRITKNDLKYAVYTANRSLVQGSAPKRIPRKGAQTGALNF